MSDSTLQRNGETCSSLPIGWARATVGAVLRRIETGSSFRCDERPPHQSEIGVVKVSAVTWGTYDEQESKTCTAPDRVDLSTLIKAGDFLFSRANTIELIGACVIAEHVTKRIMLSDKILRFDFVGINPRWALWYLRSPEGRAEIQRLSTGNQMSMRNIGQERIRQIPIPLPPIAESARILDKLDERLSELDASVANLERAERNLVRYRASVLAAACSGKLVPTEADLARHAGRTYEPADQLLARILIERRKANSKAKYEEPAQPDTSKLPKLPAGWVWATVEQLALVGSGNTPAQITDHLQPQGGVPWYKVGDMNRPGNERVMRSAEGYLSTDSVRTLRIRSFPPGTIIFPKRGGAIATNKKRLLEQEATTDLNVMGLTPPTELLPYFWLWFQSVDLGSLSDGSNIPQVNNQDILPLFVPLAPTAEQERIVAEVDRHLSRADALITSIAQAKRRAQRLRRAILAAAFQGRLVPQDPNDEPASVLLDRIRAQAVAAEQAVQSARRGRPSASAASSTVIDKAVMSPAPPRRGRPPGSKKTTFAAPDAAAQPRRRGRPPGSKNRPKT